MSNVYRKHPLSVAISMALLAAAATSAMASEPTAAPADNAGAQDACATERTDDRIARRQKSQDRDWQRRVG